MFLLPLSAPLGHHLRVHRIPKPSEGRVIRHPVRKVIQGLNQSKDVLLDLTSGAGAPGPQVAFQGIGS